MPAFGAGWADVLQGDFHASPLQACSISLFRRQLPPLPDPPAAPEVEVGRDSPGSQERASNLSYAHCSHSAARHGPSPVVTPHQHPRW